MATTRQTLLERVSTGRDEEAWRELTELYGPLVHGLALRRGLADESADALVQDVWVRLFQKLSAFEYRPDRGRFRNWVLTVASNELRMKQRAEATRRVHLEHMRREAAARVEDPSDEEREWWARAEERRLLELALDRLRVALEPERFSVFELAALRGVPVPDVASFFGLTRPQVSMIKFRALKRLQRLVSELRREWGDG